MKDFDPMELVAANLRRIRTECELTQEQLAERSGVDRTFVSMCERNHRNVTVGSIFALARGLGCDPADLLRPCDPVDFTPWWHTRRPGIEGTGSQRQQRRSRQR